MKDQDFEHAIQKVKDGSPVTRALFMKLYQHYQSLLAEYRTAIAANKAWAKREKQ